MSLNIEVLRPGKSWFVSTVPPTEVVFDLEHQRATVNILSDDADPFNATPFRVVGSKQIVGVSEIDPKLSIVEEVAVQGLSMYQRTADSA